MSPIYETLRVEPDGPVGRIVLDRPEKRNPLGRKTAEELIHAARHLDGLEEIRVLVLTGSGPAFSAGGDIQAFAESSPLEHREGVRPVAELVRTMFGLSIPTIARVQGHALGGGAGLVSMCEFAIAADDVQLGYPELSIGLFPAAVGVLLARMVPRRTAIDLLFRGRRISAAEALDLGLVNEVVPREQLDDRVDALAAELASKSPVALAHLKAAFHAQGDLPLDRAIDLALEKFVTLTTSEDAREGLAAFLEKRAPTWKGR